MAAAARPKFFGVLAAVLSPPPVVSLGYGSQSTRDVSRVQRPLWQIIVAQLPPKDAQTEWYSLAEIAPLLGIKARSLSKHCRDLWPQWEGHYRLDKSQATTLIRRVCASGRKLPAPQSLEENAKVQ